MSAMEPADRDSGDVTIGRNGVPIARKRAGAKHHRTYEIHQRRRVGESTAKLRPTAFVSAEFLDDPYPTFATLRENYPCYRDWVGNAYWISRYDDVTSILADVANYAERPKRWVYGLEGVGRDLRGELPVLQHQARALDTQTGPVVDGLIASFQKRGHADLARELAARLPLELLVRAWGIPAEEQGAFVQHLFRAQHGVHALGDAEYVGRNAYLALVEQLRPLLAARRAEPRDDLVSVIAGLSLADGPATAEDLAATLFEADHETLHGALANLWFLLLTHPEALARVRENRRPESRATKLAYLEALRHSTPVILARRWARHEVERFGQVFPEGALLICAVGAANRDPRVFRDPDAFVVGRQDLTQREPRGMYRADGLASGIAPALGLPSKHPAVPEDRPRSLYALTRDAVVAASERLLDGLPGLRLAPGESPRLRARGFGEMHTCWQLPVTFDTKR